MKTLGWIICLVCVPSLRAETVYGIPVSQGSPYSIRLSTPLQAAPAAGFFPVHIAIQNNSSADGSWRFEFTSGQGFIFPGEFSTGLTVIVPAAQNRDLWFYIPVASPGLVIASPAATAGPRGVGGAGPISLPVSTSMTTSTAIVELARRRLASAGLSGPPFIASSTIAPSVDAGIDDLIVTFRQTSQFDLPPLPADRIPAGFDVANSIGSNGSRVRIFSYREQVPRLATSIRGGGSSTIAGAIASSLFHQMGQMPPPDAISQQVTSFPVLSTRTLILLTQRGKESDLPAVPAVLPSGILVTTRPAETAGQVVRVLSYTDPATLLTLDTSTTANALETARFELMRRGFLEPAVEVSGTAQGPTAGARFTVNTLTGVLNRLVVPGAPQTAGTTATIIEAGSASRLPEPPAGSLPPNATVTVSPGLQPGDVTRVFTLYYPPGVSAVTSRGIQAETAATVRFTTPFAATVSGPGINGDHRIALGGPVTGGGGAASLPLAVSGSLESPLRTRLSMARIAGNPNLTPVDPGVLPADWRVWSSFHGLILTTAEYELLDPARRIALRQWMTLGGRVFLSRDHLAEPQVDHIGLGELHLLPSGIEDLDPSSIAEQLDLKEPGLGQPTAEIMRRADPGSALARYRVDPRAGYLLIAGFVVCFTIAVVPFNLLWLAPASRRHRVFITTPAIALGGSALLALIILFRDGIGGDGARDAVVAIMPGDNAAAVFQVQASRTGLVPSGRFPLRDDVLVMAIGAADNQAVSGNYLERRADEARGDWFRSRSMQAYHLRELLPTRARVERAGTASSGAPIVISTLATTLRDFVLIDADGRKWEIPELRAGERTSLVSAPASFSIPDWASQHLAGSEYLVKLFAAVATAEPARWVALGGKSEVAPIETLSSVDWADSRLAYTGLAEPGAAR